VSITSLAGHSSQLRPITYHAVTCEVWAFKGTVTWDGFWNVIPLYRKQRMDLVNIEFLLQSFFLIGKWSICEETICFINIGWKPFNSLTQLKKHLNLNQLSLIKRVGCASDKICVRNMGKSWKPQMLGRCIIRFSFIQFEIGNQIMLDWWKFAPAGLNCKLILLLQFEIHIV